MTLRPVAIFDADLPCGVSFIRSLGRAGIPRVVYSQHPTAIGRYSRFTSEFRACPDVGSTDEFVNWLCDEMSTGAIDLVAPTSDALVFCLAEAHEKLGRDEPGHADLAAVRDCLFKDRFAARTEAVGFPTAPWAAPTDLGDALTAADRIGYPVVLKPRSHVAVGSARGTVARTPEELVEQFVPYPIGPCHRAATVHHPDLAWPILQKYFPQHEIDIVSITGCLDDDATLTGLGHSRKLRAWPPHLGVGTRFEAVGEQPFTQRAVDTVKRVLGSGLFELEVLVHHPSGQVWPLDLNPRGYGQIGLEIGRGNDLPLRWYEAVTGADVDGQRRPPRRRPRYWQAGVHFYVGAMVRIITGPRRLASARELLRAITSPRVGSFFDWGDPLPALHNLRASVRHPRALVSPYVEHRREVERSH